MLLKGFHHESGVKLWMMPNETHQMRALLLPRPVLIERANSMNPLIYAAFESTLVRFNAAGLIVPLLDGLVRQLG